MNTLWLILFLQIVTVALKLAGFIGWAWLWVLSPSWITAAVVVFAVVGALLLWLFIIASIHFIKPRK